MQTLNASKKYKKTKIGYIPVEWSVSKLKEVCMFTYGKDWKSVACEKSNYPVFGTGGIIGYAKKPLCINPSVIIGRKGSIDKPFFVKTPFWAVDTTYYTTNLKNIIPEFLYFLSLRINWQKYNEGSSLPSLSRKTIENIKIPLPSLPEQKKIAEILSCWDNCIEKLEKLIELKEKRKKGLAQKLLTGKIRLPEFNHGTHGRHGNEKNELPEGWSNIRFSNIFKRVTRKNSIQHTNVLTISAQYGLVNQKLFFNKSVSSANLENYILLKEGEFAYNKSYSNGFPMGAIKRLDKYDCGVVSTLYICFEMIAKNGCSNFFKHFFDAGVINKEIHGIAQEGARNHGLLNISIIDFFNMKLNIPLFEEQKAIAGVLDCADKEIKKLKYKLNAVKKQKKGLMQKLLTGQIRHPEFVN